MAEKFGFSLINNFFQRPTFLKGKVTIIGGSSLFHGAPFLGLKIASRLNQMVFFSSPEPSVGKVAEQLKSKLFSFIWVPFQEISDYIEKSDAVLIGPGLMRFRKEKDVKKLENQRLGDKTGRMTKKITENLLRKFAKKQWIVDAGSLQVMDKKFIPEKAILTPNWQEFNLLFGKEIEDYSLSQKEVILKKWAKEYKCIILTKETNSLVCSAQKCYLVSGGNRGLEKGGTGDVLSGLVTALAAKKPPLLAAAAAVWVSKKAADSLYQKVGFAYNADDLADEIPSVCRQYF